MSTLRHVVVTMAGNSSRFRSFTDRPKWALTIGGKSMFERSIQSLIHSPFDVSMLTFVVQKKHRRYFLEVSTAIYIPWKFRVIELDFVPNGQLETARLGIEDYETAPTIIWNIDTYLSTFWGEGGNFPLNAFVVSKLNGADWSFATVNQGLVVRTAEKERISEFASIGMYGFQEGQLLAQPVPEDTVGESYIAPLYNSLIRKGLRVEAVEIPSDYVFPLGTPDQLRESCVRQGWSSPIFPVA